MRPPLVGKSKRMEVVKRYRALIADKRAWKHGKRPKLCWLANHRIFKNLVIKKLSLNWSPEQISGWLMLIYPCGKTMHMSHETIYKSLFIQTRGLLHKEMRNYLRIKRKFRHARIYKTGSRGRVAR